ncbi:PREDICTED: protein NRT1/ PTR FAMILY 5.8 [Prunus mume]|uniref:Protein NRT1/ PTR FAMILY 5.8 n=1 Tax=Prunus mume TaxID=102107 RepID=A0ABM0NW26_PRUMU|nr:PREDICTED: protein NRT1/ PTR FAMILY 5.8 [Prunus mume]XP_008230678.1 PREDICTED: protein NRT1/ PTR FAMILY 5.8 [Prunus mume]
MAGSGGKTLGNSCILLIVIAGMERFAYKGVASNLVTYLTDVMKMSNSAAAKTVNSWCGFTSMLPLLVAPFVDSYWDRYPTILASSFLYVAGLVALTSTALTRASSAANKTSSNSSFLFWSLYLISLGQGGYNPSLQAFGADQLDSEEELPSSKDERKSNKKSVFFQWWYFGVCSGSLLGITLMSYIQDTFGWILGFAIPMISMVTSVVVFSCGSRIYTYRESEAMDYKPIGNMVQSIKATALKLMNRRITLPNKSDVTELELQEKPLCHQNFSTNEGLVENPKSGFYVLENAKVLLRLLPIWIMLLMFAVIFQQPPTFFTKQGMTMKRNIGSQFKIPPATLQSAITLSIILLMPLYDKIMIPITRLVTCHEKGITVMQRMGIGMFISVIAMASAAVVETRRLRISREMEALGAHSETVPFSIFWLLPQYILLGISDIFTVVGMQEFFYSEVPVRMRTMAFALYTSVFGVGSYLSSLLIATVEAVTSSNGRQSWFSDDMSEARLDKYYWFLASLSALSFLLYVLLSACYRSRRDLDLDNENCK